MARFILVHGAFHGAWCWTKFIPELEKRGHAAVALDMPGQGADQAPHADVTLDAYVARICQALAADAEPAVLVGHSLGSVHVTQAAERAPERIARLIYLAGAAPRDGYSLYTTLNPVPVGAMPPPGHVWHGLSQPVASPGVVREMYYNNCNDADFAYAMAHLRPQANAPRVTPLHLTAERFGCVKRGFVGCHRDNANTPDRQKEMLASVPCDPVAYLDTDHSPFFSMPAALADIFSSMAAS